jgi:DedD protein
MADSEERINLKKQARRRLVGAIALVTFVVIALPMVFDKESKPLSRDISVQIPAPDSSAFKHNVVPMPPSSAPPSAAAAPADAPASIPVTTPPAATAPAISSAAPSLPQAVISPTPLAVSPATSPVSAKTPAPAARKPDARVTGDSNAPAVQAQLKSLPPARTPVAATPAASGTDAGTWVVKLGAFADIENVKRLQAKLSAAGIKSYTEAVDSGQNARTRVRAGPFASRAAAEHARGKLKKLGLDGPVGEK